MHMYTNWTSSKYVYSHFSNLTATVTQIELFMHCELGMGPFTIPLRTSPKHPSPSHSSMMT